MVSALYQIGSYLLGRRASDLNADSVGQPFQARVDRYVANEAYYANTAYDLWESGFAGLQRREGLYRLTSGIYNPFRRAVDWYPGAIYPGVFTNDGLPLADGTPCCVPFEAGTDERLRLAAMALLGWANWESDRYVYGAMLPMLGDAFGEIETDFERGKSYPRLHHPGYVTDIAWNATGDVTMYRLDIPQVEKDGSTAYRWGKIVDKESITTLKDGKPFGYDDQPSVVDNPYGFVPGVWVQFRNRGGQHGQSLMDGVRHKVDRLNSSASSIHDYIGKFAAQGVVLKTAAQLKDALIPLNRFLAPVAQTAERDDIRFIKGPKDLELDRLIQDLGLGAAEPYITGLIDEINADLPEASMDEKIREHGDIAAVALRMMFGDVVKRVAEAQGNADGGLRKFVQMGLAIQGHLTTQGAFGLPSQLTETQRLFLPFGLDSYARGELNVSFAPRPLFPDSAMERATAAAAREAIQTPHGLREAGYSDAEIWGEGNEPTAWPGLMESRQQATTTAADLFGRAFNQGAV